MVRVTKESLAENIGRLESYGDLSINEEYQLKAYRLLLEYFLGDKSICSCDSYNYANRHVVGRCATVCEKCSGTKYD